MSARSTEFCSTFVNRGGLPLTNTEHISVQAEGAVS